MNYSTTRLYKARSIGGKASEILSIDQEAHVSGLASRGIYFKTSSKWLVFLSFGRFRGPLTITLATASSSLQSIAMGMLAQIHSGSIFLPDLDLIIDTQGSEMWQPPPLPTQLLENAERRQKLEIISEEILVNKKQVVSGKLLPFLLDLPHRDPAPRFVGNLGWDDILQLQACIHKKELPPLVKLLASILGAGPGLTPSADDFIIGLLLTLNRWRSLLWREDSLAELNRQLVQAAYKKTTSLSANMIECATFGMADEQLVNALDWIVSGVAREPELVAHLLGWGNSSGVDTFVGMAVTLDTD